MQLKKQKHLNKSTKSKGSLLSWLQIPWRLWHIAMPDLIGWISLIIRLNGLTTLTSSLTSTSCLSISGFFPSPLQITGEWHIQLLQRMVQWFPTWGKCMPQGCASCHRGGIMLFRLWLTNPFHGVRASTFFFQLNSTSTKCKTDDDSPLSKAGKYWVKNWGKGSWELGSLSYATLGMWLS